MTTVEAPPPVDEAEGTRVTAQHELKIMNGKGDTKLMWDPANEDEVAAAHALFATLKDKGHLAYSVGQNGEQDVVIDEFDKDAKAIIMAPQLVGG